jgi:hypothetical protein
MTPAPPSTVLIVALSGLGKSTLAAHHPETVFDGDRCIYAAVADAFPRLDPRARLRAWRELSRSRPWERGGEDFELWARTRRAMFEALHAALRSGAHRLVVTSLLQPGWEVRRFYGIERGRYLEHLRRAGRALDNLQSEAINERLEGFSPLVRLPPGSFLADRPEVRTWIES